MTKIDIFSGFLGAGKTTLIKKLIAEAYQGEQILLIENEFGEIGIDGGFLQDAGVKINEMNSGCICCSLVGDFGKALQQALAEFKPDRILIEPSGVGKLSDVIRAVLKNETDEVVLDGFAAVVDAGKAKMYMKNFGEFFNDQIEHAGAIVLSRTGNISDEKLKTCVELLRAHNDKAVIITTPWDKLTGAQIAEAVARKDTLSGELEELLHAHEEAHHHHHDDDDDDACGCGHHHHDDDDDDDEHEHEHHHHHDHDDDDDEHEHHHHHHDHDDDDDDEHEHHHHHEDGEECHCGHDHHHHHHHDADEVFTSWGVETTEKFTPERLHEILEELEDTGSYGIILRAKGIVENADGSWIHFDYVPGEENIRAGAAGVTGRVCVIGSKLKEDSIRALFGV